MSQIILGFSGNRRGGKSTMSRFLEETYGFVRCHPFDGGKSFTRQYLSYQGVGFPDLYDMTCGDMKDSPSDFLPFNASGNNHYDCRHFMEKVGLIMGERLGPEFTIKAELERVRRTHGEDVNIVFESILWEYKDLQALGGKIILLNSNASRVIGVESDNVKDLITPDLTVDFDFNNQNAAKSKISDFVESIDPEIFSRDFEIPNL